MSKSHGSNLFSLGRMFHKAGAIAEKAPSLKPTKSRSLANGIHHRPSLQDLMGQADVSGGNRPSKSRVPMPCRALKVKTSILVWTQKQSGNQCRLWSRVVTYTVHEECIAVVKPEGGQGTIECKQDLLIQELVQLLHNTELS